MNTRVVLIDRHAAYRHLLGRYLQETLKSYEVVGESELGAQALPLCEEQKAHLLIMDHCLSDTTCAEVVSAMRRQMPAVRVLLASCHHTDGLTDAIDAGAHGCALKEEPWQELQSAIETVAGGGSFFSPKTLLEKRPVRVKLTRRQQEILGLIVGGFSTKQIAAELAISFKTADHHRARLMRKLRVHDLASLVRIALVQGMVKAPAPITEGPVFAR